MKKLLALALAACLALAAVGCGLNKNAGGVSAKSSLSAESKESEESAKSSNSAAAQSASHPDGTQSASRSDGAPAKDSSSSLSNSSVKEEKFGSSAVIDSFDKPETSAELADSSYVEAAVPIELIDEFAASLGSNFTVEGEYVLLVFIRIRFKFEVSGNALRANYSGTETYGESADGTDYVYKLKSDGYWHKTVAADGDFTIGKISDVFKNILASASWTGYDANTGEFTGEGSFKFKIFDFSGAFSVTLTEDGANMKMDGHSAKFSLVGSTVVNLPQNVIDDTVN